MKIDETAEQIKQLIGTIGSTFDTRALQLMHKLALGVIEVRNGAMPSERPPVASDVELGAGLRSGQYGDLQPASDIKQAANALAPHNIGPALSRAEMLAKLDLVIATGRDLNAKNQSVYAVSKMVLLADAVRASLAAQDDQQPASYGQLGAAVRSQFEDSAIHRVVVELDKWELPPGVKPSADAATKVRALVDYLACTRKRLSEAFEACDGLRRERDDYAKTNAALRRKVADLKARIDLLVNSDADR